MVAAINSKLTGFRFWHSAILQGDSPNVWLDYLWQAYLTVCLYVIVIWSYEITLVSRLGFEGIWEIVYKLAIDEHAKT